MTQGTVKRFNADSAMLHHRRRRRPGRSRPLTAIEMDGYRLLEEGQHIQFTVGSASGPCRQESVTVLLSTPTGAVVDDQKSRLPRLFALSAPACTRTAPEVGAVLHLGSRVPI